MGGLADKTCAECAAGAPPLARGKVRALHAEVPAWEAPNSHHLVRRFETKDFTSALDFVERIGALAEEQGHHPDLAFGWGWVEVKVWTHKIDGLSESDFVLAAKIDRLPPPEPPAPKGATQAVTKGPASDAEGASRAPRTRRGLGSRGARSRRSGSSSRRASRRK